MDAIRQWAYAYGYEHPEVVWVEHPSFIDVCVLNPHFKGLPTPHPLGGTEADWEEYDRLIAQGATKWPDPVNETPHIDIPF